MHIQMLIPDLPFARPSSASGPHPLLGLNLPALSLLLAEAHADPSIQAVETNLAEACGLNLSSAYGIAALTAVVDGLQAQAGSWLRADPVNMKVGQDTVYCLGQQGLELDFAESQGFIDSINGLLQEDGLKLVMGSNPMHWYIHAPELDLQTTPLSQIVAKPIGDYLPAGESGGLWRKRLTEIQMVLKGHPLNIKRRQAAKPTIDSVWFWGQGCYPPLVYRSKKDVLYGDNELAQSVALAAKIPHFPIPKEFDDLLAGSYQKIMIYEPCLQLALAEGNVDQWQAEVIQLEKTIFLPALLALKHKAIDRLIVDFSDGRAFTINRASLKKWWRRSVSLSQSLNLV
ncbi:MAG: hypothetical protein Q7V63_08640 [Gammaproteobacteria bacterium]|nr:hypothetical protein [Gammaproteobacteria bacterium]